MHETQLAAVVVQWGETRLEGNIAGCPAELKSVMGKGERVRAGGILDKEEEGQGSMQQG